MGSRLQRNNENLAHDPAIMIPIGRAGSVAGSLSFVFTRVHFVVNRLALDIAVSDGEMSQRRHAPRRLLRYRAIQEERIHRRRSLAMTLKQH